MPMSSERSHTLAGSRVLLRPPRTDDARGIFAYASDPAVTEWLTWDTHHVLAESEQFIARLQAADGQMVARIIQVEDWVAGCIALTSIPRAHRAAELGYVLHRAFWGRGLAVEAATLLMTYGFEQLGLNRIEAYCAVPNARSVRVLEKLGMKHEGTLRELRNFHGQLPDMHLYSVLRREWHPKKPTDAPHEPGNDPTDPA